MADTSISTIAPSAHPSAFNTNPRAFLAAAPALALLTAAPAFAVATFAGSSTAWDDAMRMYLRAQAEAKAFEPVYLKINAAYEVGFPTTDGIHWKEFPFGNRDRIARGMSLENDWAEFLRAEGKSWWAKNKEASDAAKSRHRAALDSVQTYRDAVARHSRDSGMDAAEENLKKLNEEEYRAEMALMDMPAPNLAALRWKLDQVLDLDPDDSLQPFTIKYVGQTIADYRRLLGSARS